MNSKTIQTTSYPTARRPTVLKAGQRVSPHPEGIKQHAILSTESQHRPSQLDRVYMFRLQAIATNDRPCRIQQHVSSCRRHAGSSSRDTRIFMLVVLTAVQPVSYISNLAYDSIYCCCNRCRCSYILFYMDIRVPHAAAVVPAGSLVWRLEE